MTTNQTTDGVLVSRDFLERIDGVLRWAHEDGSAEELEELLLQSSAQPQGELVQLAAVAVVRERDDELQLEWLLEGGLAELEPGRILMAADQKVTDDEGSGELYRAQPASVTEAR
jgi:hypothetical protein